MSKIAAFCKDSYFLAVISPIYSHIYRHVMSQKLSKPTLFSSLFCLILGCSSDPYSEKDSVYTFSGTLKTENHTNFIKVLNTKKIKLVRFENCDGGDALAGLDIAKAIKLAELQTIASGRVASSCAFAYLGGVIRTIDPANADSGIQFHGGFDATTGQPAGPVKNQKVLDYLYLDTNFKFSKKIEAVILNTKLPYEGVYFFKQSINGKMKNGALYCNGNIPLTAENCTKIDGITLESEGIVTK